MPRTILMLFKILNRFFMVPLFRLGLGGILTNPFSGYIMVLKTIGRKSGKVRYAPVNYAIWKGKIYCISGGRVHSDWYKNLIAHPQVEVIMPGGGIYGEISAPYVGENRLQLMRQVLKNAGFAGLFEGYNPWKISDADLENKTLDLPVIETSPIGLGAGASDPEGWAWIGWLTFFILLIAFLVFIF